MMMRNLRAAALGLLLAGAVPVLAQTPPPAPPAGAPGMGDRMADRMGDHMGGGMFGGLSEAGKATMRDAMKAGGDSRSEHEAVKAARDRMLALLDVDTLDTAALKRAMDDERKAAQATHDKRQAAMLAGFSKLSVVDRKAFVANARAMKARMEDRVGKMHGGRGGMGGMRGMGGRDGMVPPPPPPMM
jgi:Spy/CpxP family protein refolding chaperone